MKNPVQVAAEVLARGIHESDLEKIIMATAIVQIALNVHNQQAIETALSSTIVTDKLSN